MDPRPLAAVPRRGGLARFFFLLVRLLKTRGAWMEDGFLVVDAIH